MKLSLPRELAIIGCAIITSIAVLPGVIYLVGNRLFGVYGADGGVLSMYRATLADLAVPTLTAWTIVLSPALCIALLRLLFGLTQDRSTEPAPLAAPVRREPTINN